MNSLEGHDLPQPKTAYIRTFNYPSTAPVSRVASYPRKRSSVRERVNARNQMLLTGSLNDRASGGQPVLKTLEDPFLNYFKTQTVEYGEDADCVFLLWSSPSLSRSSTCSVMKAIDVPIQKTGTATARIRAPEAEVFRSIKGAFYKNTHSFAAYLGLRAVSAVKPIKFRLIKLHGSGLLVSPLDVDWLSEIREDCLASMAKIEERLDQYTDPENFCYPDTEQSDQFVHTHPKCDIVDSTLALSPNPVCLFEAWDSWNSHMNWIDTASFFTYYFLYPDAAKGQTILSSPFSGGLLYHYSNIKFRHERERRFLVLDGLYVEERWRNSRAVPLVVTVLFVTLVVSRLVWKSWEVVFGVASFVTAVIMLIYSIHDR